MYLQFDLVMFLVFLLVGALVLRYSLFLDERAVKTGEPNRDDQKATFWSGFGWGICWSGFGALILSFTWWRLL